MSREEKIRLKIGDHVSFKSIKFDAYCSAEGIFVEDLHVTDEMKHFDDAIFCIHFQRQYSAARELEEFNASEQLEDESTAKYLQALQRGRNNEAALNDGYMEKRVGKTVTFGEVVQLFHVKSRKYLQVYPDQLAKGERENLRVGLSATGSSMSWIQIVPRYKIDKEGDPILDDSEVYLRLLERPTEFIHCAERVPVLGVDREINCCLEETSWRMNIFQSGIDTANKSLLLASELLYIHDPETRCNLTTAKNKIESIDGDFDPIHLSDILLEPMGDIVESNCLWVIESEALVKGGPIYWKTDQVRFKNLNSGHFIKKTTRIVAADDEYEELMYDHFTVTKDPKDDGTLFQLTELNNLGNQLHVSKPLQIGQSGCWMQRSEEASIDTTINVNGTPDKSLSVNLIFIRFTQEVVLSHGDEAVSTNEPLDIHTGISARKYLRKYLVMTKLAKSSSVNTVWPTAVREDIDLFSSLVTRLIYFSQGFPVSSTNVQLGVDKADTKLRIRRQNLLREQGILEVVLRLINKLIPITVKSEENAKLNARAAALIPEEEQAMLRMGHMIVSKCLELIFYSIQDHPDNQMYVADFMPVLLAHLGNAQPLASKCVTEMLSNNMELQETKIGTREIQIFVDKLRASKMGAMYLNLLQACCSCQGNGVDNNQCKVAEMMFSDTNDIIIQVQADYTKPIICDWNAEVSLYIPSVPVPGSPIMGEWLLKNGLPTLSLSWTTKSIDFSPLGLFGQLSVNLVDLFRSLLSVTRNNPNDWAPKSAAAKLLGAKKTAALEQKVAVARYFVAELFLGAEMCMDKNYIGMGVMDKLFSFDTLVTILRLGVSSELKGAAMRLLLCQYVDRDPQTTSTIPCFTRTWSEIQKNTEPRLPFVESARKNTFCLVQQIIAEHVNEMVNAKWESYSKYVLHMFKLLVTFNFYGSSERLKDVIAPLIKALDRRHVVQADTTIVTARTPSSPRGKRRRTSIVENSIEESKVEEVVEVPDSGEALDPEKTFDQNRWEYKVLTFLESLPVMCAVLFLVLVAVIVTIYQAVTGFPDGPGTPLYIWGITVLLVFMIEVGSRMYCHTIVRNSFLTFIFNGFNQIDMLVISIDIIFLSIPTNTGGSDSKFTKTLRLIRLLRLLRVLRAAKVVNKLVDMKGEQAAAWKPPSRYAKAPMFELDTMLEAINILAYAQRIIDDRNISLLLRHFFEWESGTDKRKPGEIFDQVIVETNELTLGINDFDSVMIDVLMFIHAPLVQGVLELLMSHHSTRRTLLDNAGNVQLLVSHKRERQYKLVDQMLQQLDRNIETHELWGELHTESDLATNKQTKDIITELRDICRIRKLELEFDTNFTTDREIQNLFRNLGLFQICFKVVNLLGESGDEGVSDNILDLCQLGADLIYWFLLNNPDNQEIGFEELKFFLDNLDAKINAHKIVRAIFVNNEKLMTRVSHEYLVSLSDHICKVEKSHHYLSLFAAITYVGEKNIPTNQFAVTKYLTSQGRWQKVGLFMCPANTEEYAEKLRLMSGHDVTQNCDVEDLCDPLAYHLTLLEVLSGCCKGRLNITSVEAKVQSLYSVDDIIAAILDPATILIAKIRLCQHFLNAIIVVEMKVKGLEESECVWNLINLFSLELGNAHQVIKNLGNLDWDAEGVNRQLIEYIIVCIQILSSFFGTYYKASVFRTDMAITTAEGKTQLNLDEGLELTGRLFRIVKSIHDINSIRLSPQHKTMIHDCVRQLAKCNTDTAQVGITSHETDNSENEVEINLEFKVTAKYQLFLKELEEDESVQLKASNESLAFIAVMEALPYMKEQIEADVRYESLIKKLVSHIRENFKIVNEERRLDTSVVSVTIWIVKAFRTMLENRMGMTIFERDDNGGAEEDEKAWPVVNSLNICGATTLCVDLIAVGMDEHLQTEVVRLTVALLYKEGGAHEVQELINRYFMDTDSELYFKQARITIQKLIAHHNWHGVIVLAEGEEPKLHDDLILIRCLQLMCEGHYMPNQDIIREQPHNHTSVNLLDDFVEYLNCLSRIPCRTSTQAAIAVAATILEVIQGPCMGNQEHLALNTELIETMNRIMRAKCVRDCVKEEELSLKKTMIDIFRGLLEGQGAKSVVYERVLSVVHFDIIQEMSKPLKPEKAPMSKEDEEDEEVVDIIIPPSSDQILMQTQSTVLLKMFCAFKPSLYAELGMSENPEDLLKSGTACIEVSWRGELHRRFFHIPDVCYDLAKSTKDSTVEHVDRSNLENKLVDFLERSHGMYREVKHQQVLKSLGVSFLFNPKNQNIATWISFALACTMNVLFLISYESSSGTPDYQPSMRKVIDSVNIIQIVSAFCTLVIYMVVRSPVIYQAQQSKGYPKFECLVFTFLDPLTLYYMGYLLFSLLGFLVSDDFIPFMLLDIIVKNSTTQAVLNAVIMPGREIIMGTVLTVFMIHIYAFFMFTYFRNEFAGLTDCYTLYGCFKYSFGYGLRGGGGIGDFITYTLGDRYMLDWTFFLVITVGMLNLLAGVIITTFTRLREEKADRMENTTETCFSCGIEKQLFDRASKEPEGFKRHITVDHNMWNYIFFIFHLWEQDKDDDDGLELYIRKCIDRTDISWFPMNKAMCLNVESTSEEELHQSIKSKITMTEGVLMESFNSIQSELFVVLEQLTQAINKDLQDEQVGAQSIFTRSTTATASLDKLSNFLSADFVDAPKPYCSKFVNMKKALIGIADIVGIRKTDESQIISYKIICSNGIFSSECESFAGNRSIFDVNNLVIVSKGVASIADEDIIRIQIMSAVNDQSQCLGALEVSQNAIMLADGTMMEVTFNLADQLEPCMIRFVCALKSIDVANA